MLQGIESVEGGEVMEAAQYKNARMDFNGTELRVSTGVVERRWRVTPSGLATVSLKDLRSNHDFAQEDIEKSADWMFSDMGKGKLVSLTAWQDDDNAFSQPFLKVRAVFSYKAYTIGYVIWAYPNAAGLRTQVELKAATNFTQDQTDAIPLKKGINAITAFGYRQGIKTTAKNPILREETSPFAEMNIDWANGIVLSTEDQGVIMVKESHKHLDLDKKVDRLCGGFEVKDGTVIATGCGYEPQQVKKESLPCWANWVILYEGSAENAELALKMFDRTRYFIKPDRDIFIMANTWGSEDGRLPCIHAAREENVLGEIESVADLGIDVLQIDDGWQTDQWTPAAKASNVQLPFKQDSRKALIKLFGNYNVYPNGFAKVRRKAKEAGVTLGLWSAWSIPLDKLQLNYDAGNFKHFKLDFADLRNKREADELLGKARDIVAHSGHTARVNWDVTEIPPRMGYYFGREVGNIYLANRKTGTDRARVQYVPSEMLRNAWYLAKYSNLNQFQVTVVNKDYAGTFKKHPSYDLYDHSYLVGISLMSSPIFFQETRHYAPEAREQVKSILGPYKEHREKMYQGYVFCIGEVPNGKNWTGFQCYIPGSNSGYLTIFREGKNHESRYTYTLAFLKNRKVTLTDLVTGKTIETAIDADGKLTVNIESPGRFRFMKMDF
jgi:hypothetical protein